MCIICDRRTWFAVYLKLFIKACIALNSHLGGINKRLIRGDGYTSLSVPGKDEGVNHRLQINDSGIAAVYHSDSTGGNWDSNPIALKSDLGNTNNMQLMQAYPDNIDDPPLAIILQAHLNNTLGTLPTEIGGSVFLILQSNPTIRYRQYNSQLAFGFGGDKIAFRRRSGGGWTEWKYLIFP